MVTNEESLLRKLEMLRKFAELQRLGIKLSQTYNMNSDYEVMQREYEIHKTMRERENSTKYMQKMLLATTVCVELLNERYNPLDLKLKGLSEKIQKNMDNYNKVFVDLYGKLHYNYYPNQSSTMKPELRLMVIFFGDILIQHLTNAIT
jgi:hypothetical protein